MDDVYVACPGEPVIVVRAENKMSLRNTSLQDAIKSYGQLGKAPAYNIYTDGQTAADIEIHARIAKATNIYHHNPYV